MSRDGLKNNNYKFLLMNTNIIYTYIVFTSDTTGVIDLFIKKKIIIINVGDKDTDGRWNV